MKNIKTREKIIRNIDLGFALITLITGAVLVVYQIINQPAFIPNQDYIYWTLIIISFLYLIFKIIIGKVTGATAIMYLVVAILIGILSVILYITQKQIFGDVVTATSALIVFLSNDFFFYSPKRTAKEETLYYLNRILKKVLKPDSKYVFSRINHSAAKHLCLCYTIIQSDESFHKQEKESFLEKNKSYFDHFSRWGMPNKKSINPTYEQTLSYYTSFYTAIQAFIKKYLYNAEDSTDTDTILISSPLYDFCTLKLQELDQLGENATDREISKLLGIYSSVINSRLFDKTEINTLISRNVKFYDSLNRSYILNGEVRNNYSQLKGALIGFLQRS